MLFLVYGCVLKELSFTEAIKMYKIIPWNLSVLEHLKEFNDNNIKIKKIEIVKLEDIKKNKELNDFIKEVFYQFSKLYKVDEIKIALILRKISHFLFRNIFCD